jgi:hypothetical protein
MLFYKQQLSQIVNCVLTPSLVFIQLTSASGSAIEICRESLTHVLIAQNQLDFNSNLLVKITL